MRCGLILTSERVFQTGKALAYLLNFRRYQVLFQRVNLTCYPLKRRIRNSSLYLIAASERSERAATPIWPSRTAHLYIALSILDFFLARDISFYEYVVHRSAVKRDSVRPHAGLPEIYCRFGREEFEKNIKIRLYSYTISNAT